MASGIEVCDDGDLMLGHSFSWDRWT